MKITVKTLQQKTFQLDAEPSETVADLKKKIEEGHGHPVATQKLIYSGQVLGDDKTVESCNIKEKGFLVLMVAKPKAEPKPAAAATPAAAAAATSAAPSNPPAAAPAAAPAPATSIPAAAPPQPPNAPILTPAQAAPVSTPAQSARAINDENAFVTGADLQTAVQNMMEMGFEREQAMRALRASYNNPERAVEYLFNGIPSHLEDVAAGTRAPQAQAPATPASAPAPAQAAQAPVPIPVEQLPRAPPAAGQPQNLFQLAQQQQAQQPGAAGARQPGQPGLSLPGGGGGGGGGLDISQLQSQPQIQHLRQLLQQNPALIQPVLHQLAQSNPELAELFTQHPEAIAQAIGLTPDDLEGGGDIPEGAHVIHVTEEEQAAIQRLQDLGFSRAAAIEAYFACDKDEAMAANYLFDSENQAD